MHIIQLTDLHLSTADEKPYEIDVRANFIQALEEIKAFSPDLLVVSGDLCYTEGIRSIYEWAKEQLDALPFPYQVIPGNHDDPAMMIDVFGLEEQSESEQIFYTLDTDKQKLLFLDTTYYVLPELQLNWLANELQKSEGALSIFMHHPPAHMGVPFMDNEHALKNHEAVMDVLNTYEHPITIFTGHYHVDKSLRKGNVDVHICPSIFFQIDWRETAFKVEHTRPAFRSIRLSAESVEHGVVYF